MNLKTKPFENFKSDSSLLKELENKIKYHKYINVNYEINKKIKKFVAKPYENNVYKREFLFSLWNRTWKFRICTI